MTSLPMPACFSSTEAFPFPNLPEGSREESEKFLLQAFHSFAEAADSLERSYGMLRAEVARLRGELEHTNAGLERSLAENRRMRQHLDRILEGIPSGILALKADGEVSLLNPEGRRLLALHGVCDFDSLSRMPGELRDLLGRAQSKPEEQEQCFAGEGSEPRWLAARHAAIEGEAGGADTVLIFILRDVTESKRLAVERDKLRRQQALAEMSAILAHEIRNPLGSLELFAGLLAGAELGSEARRWIDQVQAGLRTLAATVNNVLHFHSLPPPARVPCDLARLLDWAGEFLLPMARQAGVKLRLHNRLEGVWFAADRHCLEQVLLNLVLNALRAMPAGGQLEICGRNADEPAAMTALLSVADTGPGIGAGDAARIFEPGFSTRAGSPGLGLAVCRKILEQHGGSLAAANRAGGGAIFTVTLPLEEASQSAGQVWQEELPASDFRENDFRESGLLESGLPENGLQRNGLQEHALQERVQE
jgi:two-component system sensor histidine kinase FlrB